MLNACLDTCNFLMEFQLDFTRYVDHQKTLFNCPNELIKKHKQIREQISLKCNGSTNIYLNHFEENYSSFMILHSFTSYVKNKIILLQNNPTMYHQLKTTSFYTELSAQCIDIRSTFLLYCDIFEKLWSTYNTLPINEELINCYKCDKIKISAYFENLSNLIGSLK